MCILICDEKIHLNNDSMVKDMFFNREVKDSNLLTCTQGWWARCSSGLGS
jgi:hypothetical protein